MDSLQKSLSQLAALVRGLSPQGRVVAVVAAALVLGGLGAIVAYAGTPDYAPLFTSLSENDAARILDKLRASQVPYKLSADGRAISVPWERVPELRVDLASEGAVKGSGGAGLELFERGTLGQTDLAEHVTLTRALQGELARTIGGLEPVERALVHLGRPRPSAFLGSTDRPATASVVLRLKPGRSLSARQVAGIRELVAASVEGLEPARVSVLDASGAALANMGSAATAVEGGEAPGFEHERAAEEHLTKKAQSLLDQVFGPGKALVRVAAKVTRERVEERREKWDPTGIARTETTTTRSNVTKGARGSTAGVSANVPGGSTKAGAGDDENKETEETTTTSYEIGKTTQVVQKEAGSIERLSVGLLLDESLDKSADRVEKIVKEAVGFEPKRGDTFERGSLAFTKSDVSEDGKRAFEESDARERTRELVRQIGLGAAILLAAAIGFVAVKRPARPATAPASAPVAPPSPQDLAAAEQERRKRLKAEAVKDVETNPEAAGRLLEEWLTSPATNNRLASPAEKGKPA